MRRLLASLAAAAAAAGVLAGCASAPAGPPAAGSVAAVVAGQEIPVSAVQDRLRSAAPTLRTALAAQAAQSGGTPPALDAATLANRSRALLSTSVLHTLVGVESRRQGVTLPPGAVDAQLGGPDGTQRLAERFGLDTATVRDLVGDQLTAEQIGRRIYDRLAVTLDYATVPDRPTADALVRRLAGGEDPGRVFGGLPPGTAGVDLTLRPGGTAESRSPLVSQLYGVPANTVAVSSVARAQQASAGAQDPTGGGWLVVHVRKRDLSAPPPGPGVTPAAAVDPGSMIEFGLRMLQPIPETQDVRVNPRFGVWDPTSLEVTTPDGAGAVTPVATSAP